MEKKELEKIKESLHKKIDQEIANNIKEKNRDWKISLSMILECADKEVDKVEASRISTAYDYMKKEAFEYLSTLDNDQDLIEVFFYLLHTTTQKKETVSFKSKVEA